MAKFFGPTKISMIHGKIKKINERYVVAMFHPAAALHQPALKNTLLEDFSKLKKYLEEIDSRKQERQETKPVNDVNEKEERDKPTQLTLF